MVMGPLVMTSSSPGACACPSCAINRAVDPMRINPVAATKARLQAGDIFIILFLVRTLAGIDRRRFLQKVFLEKWAAGRGRLEIHQRLKIICRRGEERRPQRRLL